MKKRIEDMGYKKGKKNISQSEEKILNFIVSKINTTKIILTYHVLL